MKLRISVIIAAAFLAANPVLADKAPTVDELLEILGESNKRAKLDKGGIIWGGASQNEANDASLAGYMVARVNGSIPDIIKFLNTSPDMPSMKIYPIADSSDETLGKALKQVVFTKKDKKDVKLLLDPKPNSKFNYSNAEIAEIAKLMKAYKAGETDYKTDEEVAGAALQNLMAKRYRAYLKDGLAGIAPYQRSETKQDNPGEQFIDAAGALIAAPKYFPDFMKALHDFPKGAESGSYENVHSMMIEEAQGRVLYTLNHAMIEQTDDFAYIMQREYYLSHTLEILSIITLMIKDEQGTLMVILAQTATDMVAGAARPIAGPIGRTVMSYNLKPLFKVLQEEFGK